MQLRCDRPPHHACRAIDGRIVVARLTKATRATACKTATTLMLTALLAGCASPGSSVAPSDWSLLVQSVGQSGVPIESIRVESAGDVRRAMGTGPLMVVARADLPAKRQLIDLASPLFDSDTLLAASDSAASTAEAQPLQAAPPPGPFAPRLRGMRRSNGTLRQRWLHGPQAQALWTRLQALTNPVSTNPVLANPVLANPVVTSEVFINTASSSSQGSPTL